MSRTGPGFGLQAEAARDEDLYGGYEDGPSSRSGGVFQPLGLDVSNQPPGTAMLPPGTSMGKSYVAPGTAARMGTAMGAGYDPARPMTSNRGAGFTSVPNKKFDPLSQTRASTGAGAKAQLLQKADSSLEEQQAKELERKVHELLELSAATLNKGDAPTALDKAIEAKKRERALCKYRDMNSMGDAINVDLTFACDLNLACMYQANTNFKEALDLYTQMVRNKGYSSGGRLRINMGNIYFEQKKYTNAIKMYRMALDQIPATSKEVRFKIMRNIGLAFVRLGQYQDALQSFTQVMDHSPDHQTGYNLVVCAYALGDREGMKDAYVRLLSVRSYEEDEEDEEEMSGLMANEEDDMQQVASLTQYSIAVVQDDGLKEELRKRLNHITRGIVSSAQLISEKIDRQGGFQAGFDWCAEQLRAAGAGAARLANEVELAKASKFLANKDFEAAIEVFKAKPCVQNLTGNNLLHHLAALDATYCVSLVLLAPGAAMPSLVVLGGLQEFEKKEPRMKARAATNLAFLYLLEAEADAADKYADLALKSDRYNARAFVNKGCVLVEKGDLEGGRDLFREAAGIEPYCVEALYNLGLVHQRLGEPQVALAVFRKLHAMLPDNNDVLWQISQCYDIMGDFKQSVKWLEMLSSLVPNDPGVLARLGAIHARADDELRALHFYQESARVFPVNMDVISWLGAYHVKNEVYEKAMPFFDLASKIQPQEVKWALMVASCYRRIGAYPQALAKYKEINTTHPTNAECLRYLVHLCTELGRRDDAQRYMTELRKAERAMAAEASAMTVAQHAAMAAAATPPQPAAANGGFTEGELSPGLNVPVTRGKKVVAKEDAGHDDWGNEELGDDLLPHLICFKQKHLQAALLNTAVAIESVNTLQSGPRRANP
ncbi:hypothetical protein QJQ45_019632 [Haematococcus lacustris]|nr:hypothetical protein QJQ45_019632 [Haematococcus lacustris]